MTSESLSSRELPLDFGTDICLRDLAKMVRLANKFSCSVQFRSGEQRVDGKSFIGVSNLNFGKNSPVVIETWGVDARECLWALCRVVTQCIIQREQKKQLELKFEVNQPHQGITSL